MQSKISIKIHLRSISAPSIYSLLMWFCHVALKYWKFHFLCDRFKLQTCQQMQSCLVPHEWSIACCVILLVLLTHFETHRCLSKFCKVGAILKISCWIFHASRIDYINIVRWTIVVHSNGQMLQLQVDVKDTK